MLTKNEIFEQIKSKNSFLCVGLDPEMGKLPKHLLATEDPIFEFNKEIIDVTKEFAVAYKPNIAFYEALGPKGWLSLQKTLAYIPDACFTIADAKRGDIGNTSTLYAKTFFDPLSSGLDFDAVTVAPYMGKDSVTPFFEFQNKWVIILALTSNSGSADFQELQSGSDFVFEKVLKTSAQWGTDHNTMYVVGATKAEKLSEIRKIIPEHFLLVPGVGAQGGSLIETAKYGMNTSCGLLVNSSRGIIYASSGEDFGEKAHQAAQQMQEEMKQCLETYLK